MPVVQAISPTDFTLYNVGFAFRKQQERTMDSKSGLPRREFLKQAAGAVGAATQLGGWTASAESQASAAGVGKPASSGVDIGTYPMTYEGDHLKMLAFPLGGVGAGSLSLGGRGQLRDWEIFNRPNVGFSP